jgi:UDP-GlcNAc:undecaprenyl-phosphate GlcNAc-1-phosphate transferase
MQQLPALALSLLAALVATRLLMPLARRLGHHWGLVDRPSWRRRQKEAVPCSGGLAIYLVVVVAATILWLIAGPAFDGTAIMALGFAGLGMLVLGVVDDRFGLHAEKKLLGQALVATIPMAAGLTLETLWLPGFGLVNLGPTAGAITLLWYLGFINSINLIDGLDGLAGGIVMLVLGAIFLGVVGKDPVGMIWSIVLFGAVAGFLRDNLSAQRIFLGDAGSMLLGLWLAGLALGLGSATPTVPWLALCAMFIPVLDTTSTILRRWRRGSSVFRPDAEHLHHRLLEVGVSPFRAIIVLWSVTAAAAAAGVAIAVHWSAALVVVAGTAIAFVELAYTLNREDDPSLAQVLGYIVGVRRHLDAVQEVTSQLAEVIEMDSWRPRSRPRIGGGMDGTVGPVAATDAPESLATKTTVAEEKTDVVLALPEDHPR